MFIVHCSCSLFIVPTVLLSSLMIFSFYIYQYNQKIFVIVFPNVPQVLISKMSKIFPLGGQSQLKVEKALETNYHSTAAAKCPLT